MTASPGYFSSSLLEMAGETLEAVSGPIRVACNSDLHPLDVQTAKAAKAGLWKSWTGMFPEARLEGAPMEAQTHISWVEHFTLAHTA